MECVDCDRSPSCIYMIDGTTCEDASKGKVNYIKGKDCPLDKPPLGCIPAWLTSRERISELSEAITREAKAGKDTKLIKKWATEILYHVEILENCK